MIKGLHVKDRGFGILEERQGVETQAMRWSFKLVNSEKHDHLVPFKTPLETIRHGDHVELLCHSTGYGPYPSPGNPPVGGMPIVWDPKDNELSVCTKNGMIDLAMHKEIDVFPDNIKAIFETHSNEIFNKVTAEVRKWV
jgi:hypothetical protein